MPKQEFVFEIDVPDGWKAVDYRVPKPGDKYIDEDGLYLTRTGFSCDSTKRFILKRKQPARMEIIFEEVTSKKIEGGMYYTDKNIHNPKMWVSGAHDAAHDFSGCSHTIVWRLVEKKYIEGDG